MGGPPGRPNKKQSAPGRIRPGALRRQCRLMKETGKSRVALWRRKNFEKMNGFSLGKRIKSEGTTKDSDTEGRIHMKKALIGILAAVTVVAVGTVGTFAAGPWGGRHSASGTCGTGTGVCRYLDADHDGVCDFCGADGAVCVSQNGTGRYYQDENGDGICDHWDGTSCAGQGGVFRAGHGCR